MNTVTVTLDFEKETKGAIRYANVREGEKEAVTVIYLRKSGLNGEPYPKQIHVTIEDAGDK